MALPIIPLLVSLAPTVAGWIGGDKTGKAVETVTSIAREIFGADAAGSADALERAIAADPEKALIFKSRLIAAESEERQRQHDELMAYLADTQSARSQTVALARAGSPIAYGAVVISTIITVSFALMLYVVLTRAIPTDALAIANVLLGTLAAAQAQVVNYWLGSSRSSEIKNATIDKLTGR